MKSLLVYLRHYVHLLLSLILITLLAGCEAVPTPSGMPPPSATPAPGIQKLSPTDHQALYLDFLETVFHVMDEKYYQDVSRKTYEDFVKVFIEKILPQVTLTAKRNDMLVWRAAGLLVNRLKDPLDTFTNFIPPKEAEVYAQKVYGYEHGIGIEGHRADRRYEITHVQRHSDAFSKGIRAGSFITAINTTAISDLTDDDINALLYPPLETEIHLDIATPATETILSYTVQCLEYFIETITEYPKTPPGVGYLHIAAFNRMTADDVRDYLKRFQHNELSWLVLDLRHNPGGPPLAVKGMAGFFLPPKQKLFYYKKKNAAPFGLVTPLSDITYDGNLIVVVDDKSGSSAECMAGVLSAHERAMVMGQTRTAGLAFLKGAHTFDDGSMLALMTGKTFLFNGTEVSRGGIMPDHIIPSEVTDIPAYVLNYIEQQSLNKPLKK